LTFQFECYFSYVCEHGSKHFDLLINTPNSCLFGVRSRFKAYVESERKKKSLLCFQLLLGVFFSTRSVALIDDLPKMEEGEGYKSSARFVVKYLQHNGYYMTVKVYTF